MGHRDPEKRREYDRRYRERNRERIRQRDRNRVRPPQDPEYYRQYVEANRERIAERRRAWRAANLEAIREKERRYKQKNAERVREYMYEYSRQRRASGVYLERERELQRQWRAQNKDRTALAIMKRNHGMGPDDWAALWEAQKGLCYLCGREMDPARTHTDHDHRCCPPGASCGYCRRGLAHQLCNALIGMVDDDPGVLRLIADNLEITLRLVDARLAAKPQQFTLDEVAWDRTGAAVAVAALPAPGTGLRAVRAAP